VSSFFTEELTDCSLQVICRVQIWILVKTTNTVNDIPKEWVCENAIKTHVLIASHWFRIFLILTKLEYSKHAAG